jgi:quinol monooxygenase YgiN
VPKRRQARTHGEIPLSAHASKHATRTYCEEMVIVAGWLRVAAESRDSYLLECRSVIEQARKAPGCIEFCLSPDIIDLERINVFEQWETVEAVERFRGSGPSPDQQSSIINAQVSQHEVSFSMNLT